MKSFMKNVLVSIILVLGFQYAVAQQSSAKERKEERKLEKQKKAMENYDQLYTLLADTNFIFEAHTAFRAKGDVLKLNQLTNFFAIEGDKANLQLAMNSMLGMDGYNAAGRLVKYELNTKGVKKPLVIYGRVEPSNRSGNVPFTLTVFNNGKAKLEINPLNSRQYVLEGEVMAHENASVYKSLPNFGR